MFTRAKPDPIPMPKRFWKEAAVGPQGEDGYPVLLDGRNAKTPGGVRLALPTHALAQIVADEWAAQGTSMNIAAMAATRFAFTAIERIPAAREGVADEVSSFAGSDLLCYFAEGPDALLAREVEHWVPVLEWAERDLGLQFHRVTGIQHQAQPPETLAKVRSMALELDNFELAALSWATALFGSAVLAFAVQRGQLGGEAAYELSTIDEAFQVERWGEDEDAAARTQAQKAEAVLIGRWFEALRH
jgi:chaperone required for assembly of F1-ATPase